MKYLKNVKMSLYFEDPGLNTVTQEKFCNVTVLNVCAGRDLDGCGWGFGPSCALRGRHCG